MGWLSYVKAETLKTRWNILQSIKVCADANQVGFLDDDKASEIFRDFADRLHRIDTEPSASVNSLATEHCVCCQAYILRVDISKKFCMTCWYAFRVRQQKEELNHGS